MVAAAVFGLLLVAAASAQYQNSAHLIVRKDITSEDCLIDGVASQCVTAWKEAVAHYTIYNVGTRCACTALVTAGRAYDAQLCLCVGTSVAAWVAQRGGGRGLARRLPR